MRAQGSSSHFNTLEAPGLSLPAPDEALYRGESHRNRRHTVGPLLLATERAHPGGMGSACSGGTDRLWPALSGHEVHEGDAWPLRDPELSLPRVTAPSGWENWVRFDKAWHGSGLWGREEERESTLLWLSLVP